MQQLHYYTYNYNQYTGDYKEREGQTDLAAPQQDQQDQRPKIVLYNLLTTIIVYI